MERKRLERNRRAKIRRAERKARDAKIRTLVQESKDWPAVRVGWIDQSEMYDWFEEQGYVFEQDYWGYPVSFGGTEYMVNIRPGPVATYAKLKWGCHA